VLKKIGILGGMGPFATLDLLQKIVINTPAQTDQEHLPIIIYNNPQIPPRLIDAQKPNPLPELIKTAVTLEQAGADFIVMPCHTAHNWINQLRNEVTIPFYSIIENTVQEVAEEFETKKNKQILLLATKTTIQAQLYQEAFKNSSFEIIIPNETEQKLVDAAITNVKGGQQANNQSIGMLNQMINAYSNKNIKMLLGCCTEVPLMFPYLKTEMELIDPTLKLAIMAIKKAALFN
jgi:aspartate racemase